MPMSPTATQMGERKVTVWGKEYTVTTERVAKTQWKATGEYNGKSHSSKAGTEGAAVKRWREWATYQGNA